MSVVNALAVANTLGAAGPMSDANAVGLTYFYMGRSGDPGPYTIIQWAAPHQFRITSEFGDAAFRRCGVPLESGGSRTTLARLVL